VACRCFAGQCGQALYEAIIDVAVGPILARFVGPNDGVVSVVKMSGGMSIRGAVAAAHVSADETQAQMQPTVACLEALLAPVRARLDGVTGPHMLDVSAGIRQGSLLGIAWPPRAARVCADPNPPGRLPPRRSWFIMGHNASRVLPMICPHSVSEVTVSSQPGASSGGQARAASTRGSVIQTTLLWNSSCQLTSGPLVGGLLGWAAVRRV